MQLTHQPHPKLLHPSQGIITDLLNWAIRHFGYSEVILIKDIVPTLSAIIIGFIIALFVVSFFLKGMTVFHDKDAEEVSVTKLKRDKKTRLIVTTTECLFHYKQFTWLTVIISTILVKCCPVKQVKFVDKRSTRIIITSLIVIVLAVCIFTIVVDFHTILPDHHGGYKIYSFKDAPSQ